jgi:hypothetical protein
MDIYRVKGGGWPLYWRGGHVFGNSVKQVFDPKKSQKQLRRPLPRNAPVRIQPSNRGFWCKLQRSLGVKLIESTVTVSSVPRHVCPLHVPWYTVRTSPSLRPLHSATFAWLCRASGCFTARPHFTTRSSAVLCLSCNDLNLQFI